MSWLERLKAPPPPPPAAKPLGKALTKRQREKSHTRPLVIEEHKTDHKRKTRSRKRQEQDTLEEDVFDLGPLTADPQVVCWREAGGALVCMSPEGLAALCAALNTQCAN